MVWNAALRSGLMCVLALLLGFTSPPCKARIYTNHWAVRINGGPDFADHIADKYGYRNMGQVCLHWFLFKLSCLHLSGVIFGSIDYYMPPSPQHVLFHRTVAYINFYVNME